ncbi:hypothetical protein D3C86_2133500 [compost metagenome]
MSLYRLRLMTMPVLLPSSAVQPSPLARPTNSVPILLLAPPRLSTITGTPRRFDKPGATMRARMSVVPPGG